MRLLSAVFFLLPFLAAAQANACHLPQPSSAIVLTVEGQVQHCNEGLVARFDLPMLEALPKRKVTTRNPWVEGIVTYEGVLLRDLMHFVEANGTVLRFVALNDYSADMPAADAEEIDVILAYRRNGQLMTVREKGPLFVVFPFSDQPFLDTNERHAQSVWQVARITVR
jgi:hypothetical protein